MPFPLEDAVIRDSKHVRVLRHAARGGQPCRYEKVFKPAVPGARLDKSTPTH